MGPSTQDVATQTEWPETSSTENLEVYRKGKVTTCDVECQFPHDIVEEALSDHHMLEKPSGTQYMYLALATS